MASVKQKLVIGKLLEDPSLSIYRAMRAVGYAHTTAIAPTKNMGKGFKELLEEYLPDTLLLDALQEDIKAKKGNRSKELDLAFKVKGKLTPNPDAPPQGNTYNTFIQQNNLNPNAPEARTLVDNTLEMLMQQTKRKVLTDDNQTS